VIVTAIALADKFEAEGRWQIVPPAGPNLDKRARRTLVSTIGAHSARLGIESS
jgi:hypothetical protein